MNDPGTTNAALQEVRKTRDTAARLANGDYPEDADHVRVLAGMIQQLAEQIERLTDGSAVGTVTSGRPDAAADQPARKDAEAAVEEDQTPRDAPAQPINDRSEQ
jgi:cytochrome c556